MMSNTNATDAISDVERIIHNHVEIDREKLIPGQHIFAYRAVGSYSHHGIYVGRDSKKRHVQYVIHFLSNPQKDSSTSSQKCENCNYRKDVDGGVVRTCLDCFINDGGTLGGTKLYLFQYGVSGTGKETCHPGSCSRARVKPLEEIVKTAYKRLNEPNNRPYNLVTYNCETFATECSTDNGESGQVNYVATASAAIGAGLVAGALGYWAYKMVKHYLVDEEEENQNQSTK